MAEPGSSQAKSPRSPTLLDAVAPVVLLTVLIVFTIVIFGVDSSTGPLQIALMTSAVFAGLVAFKNRGLLPNERQ